MASFQKRGKTWQYTVSRMVNGKSKPIRKGGFRTKREAQIAAAEVEAKLNKGVPIQLELVPINEYFEKWVELYKANVSKSTKTHYKNTLRIINEYFGSTPLQHIRRNDYQLFINQYGKGKSRETVKKINSHIRACVLDAMDDGIVSRDFTRNIELSGRPPRKASEKHLSYNESEKLLTKLYKRIEKEQRLVHYIILLALTSGMRFAEIVALTRSDFDFKDNTINVNKSWGYSPSTEKGARSTKTTTSDRIIKMDIKTMKAFKNLFKKIPDNIHRLVFYHPASKYKVYSNTGVNKALRLLLKELNIDTISIHGLRHTHASVLLYKDISIQYISERLGHADVDTTIRVYTHMVQELREKDEEKTINVFASM